MSIPQAATLWLGRKQYAAECDDRFRMNVASLRRMVADDLENGMTHLSGCQAPETVKKPRDDPRNAIADVAKEFGTWFTSTERMGTGALDETKRSLLMDARADSVSRDPQRAIAPIDPGCCFRDEAKARSASFDERLHQGTTSRRDESFAFELWYGLSDDAVR